MKKELLIDFFLSAAGGAAIWALSPVIVGKPEPWDAESFYYVLALLAVGLLLGVVRPRRFWIHYPGVFFGQLIYMLLFLPLGPLIVMGLVFLAGYSLLSLAGAAGGAGMRRLAGRWSGGDGVQ